MINVFKVKKYCALMINSFLSAILMFIGFTYYGIFGGLGFLFVGVLLGVLLGNIFLNNPFTEMLEGKGILTLNIDSTGIIRPFVVAVDSPYIRGFFNKKPVNDVFDRESVNQLATPKKAETSLEQLEDGGVKITLSEKDYNAGRFALFHYPVLIYNSQINNIITKDFLSDQEKSTFAEHGVLYLNRKMEELTSAMLNFGRYVVETLKPKSSIFENKWFWVVLIGALVIMGFMFAPAIISAVKGISADFAATTTDAFPNAVNPIG